MNNEARPRSKDELLGEEARLVELLRIKAEQTATNVAAGVIAEGALDEDREALEAELAEVRSQLSAIRTRESEDRIDDARQAPLQGLE